MELKPNTSSANYTKKSDFLTFFIKCNFIALLENISDKCATKMLWLEKEKNN